MNLKNGNYNTYTFLLLKAIKNYRVALDRVQTHILNHLQLKHVSALCDHVTMNVDVILNG